ncbi:MAG: SgcJ/EcaC family oxidoreductase [Erythrobacter sp.]|nr:SgcJ/EcaC family oxidoreductase [Erythrobacter sp.]
MSRLHLALIAPLAVLAGCAQSADTPAPVDSDAVLEAIAAVEQGQEAAFNADDVDGALAVYAPDARFFDAGSPPLVGAEAIRPAFTAMLADPAAALAITRLDAWVAASGELAVTVSSYDQTYTGEAGAPVHVSGVNQTVWGLQDDGSWKIVADFNGGTGAAAAAPPAAPEEAAPEEAAPAQ